MLVPACRNRRACEGASSEADPARGGREPSSEAEPTRGWSEPSSEAEPARGAFDWATPVGRGDHRSVGRAPCVCLSERCFTLVFLQVLSRISPLVLGDPQGCPRQVGTGTSLKNHNFFRMNSSGDKFYLKIVGFVEIYSFVVQTFFI
jgi:hypothetical protein